MKIREGFVSNSSSSSYIIGSKNDISEDVLDIVSMFVPIDKMGSTKEDVLDSMKTLFHMDAEELSWEENQEALQNYYDFIDKGYTLYHLDVDYNMEHFDISALIRKGFVLVEDRS